MGMGLDSQQQLDKLFEVVQSAYDHGGRKFIFFNVPPTDRSPAARMLFLLCFLIMFKYLKTYQRELGYGPELTFGIVIWRP